MAQAYNDELVPKINAVLDQFTGDTIPQIHTALENTEEVVNEVGSAKAKKSFANCKEGTVEVLKAIEELMESLTKLKEYYDKLDQALN
jgi:archaellum component FlaC